MQDNLVIVDGKKMRHGGIELVNATNGQGQYLGGVVTQAKSNEIPAARQVLSGFGHLIRFPFHLPLSSQTQGFICVEVNTSMFGQDIMSNFVKDAEPKAFIS